jgi:hypothetical protein
MDHAMRMDAPLECLPVDVLVAVLAAARSVPDLRALVGASPVVYRVFLSAKRAVLLAILDRDLGPALRDAVAAALLAPARLATEEAATAIRHYATLPRGLGARALARGLPDGDLFMLVKTNRSVQFLVDEFASRRSALRQIHPDAAGPLTAQERWRLARALLRHQFLARIQRGEHAPHADNLLGAFFALCTPWEMQQLADVHSFVVKILSRAFTPVRNRVGSSLQSGRLLRSIEAEKDVVLRSLRALHRKFVEEGAHEETQQAVSAEFDEFRCRPASGLGARFNFLVAGPLPRQTGADRVLQAHWGLRDELYRCEDAKPSLVHTGDHDDASPPFGWVDANDGLDCQRWGRHLRREVLSPGQDDTTAYQRIWMNWRLSYWRWLGFAFWDKARIELLKSRLPMYQTGWLRVAPPSSEDCKAELSSLPPNPTLSPGRSRGRRTRAVG